MARTPAFLLDANLAVGARRSRAKVAACDCRLSTRIHETVIAAIRAACLFALMLLGHTAQATQILVVVRYDDYSNFSNTQIEQALFAGVESLGSGILVGVIPFPYSAYPEPKSTTRSLRAKLSDDKIRLLAEYMSRGTIEIAVHGYSHRSNVTSGRDSEFAGMPEDTQRQLLKDAKTSLEAALGSRLTAFVPPFNSYDVGTLRALQDNGYKLLSAPPDGPALPGTGLDYLPGTTYAQKLKAVIAEAMRKGHTDGIVVAVIHAYDIRGYGQSIPGFRGQAPQMDLDQLMADLRSITQSPDVRLVSTRQLYDGGEDLSVDRFHANAALNANFIARHRLLPEFVGAYSVIGLYYSQGGAQSLHRWQIAAFLALYGAVLALAALASRVTLSHFRHHRGSASAIAGATAAAIALLLIWKSNASGFYMTSAIGLTICLGIVIGIIGDRVRSSERAVKAHAPEPGSD